MIITLDDLASIRERHAGQKIVLTSGTFDLLHAGHLDYLEKVKQYGDIVMVLLSSDDRVRARKGTSRPIITERDRARMLDGLKVVDYVFIDPSKLNPDETDPIHAEILSKLQPDYYVTDGPDPRFIDLMDKLKFIILERMHSAPSTTTIIERITGPAAMKLYRFSPIKNDEECAQVLEYITDNLRQLSSLVIKESLPINTLKIFAHYEDEYSFLKHWVDNLGKNEDEGSATSYYVKPEKPMTIKNEPIDYIGIRVPDPYRWHVGCGDFVVSNFDELKIKYLGKSPYIREIQHQKYQMLELFHPDIDVLGYIVKE